MVTLSKRSAKQNTVPSNAKAADATTLGRASAGARLPEFQRPPLIEVVLSVGFEPISGLGFRELARLWVETFSRAFPKVEEQGRYEMPPEDVRPRGIPRLRVQTTPPASRLWFVDEPGSQLVQIQNDWFARNWRKVGSGDYPRYLNLREPFLADLDRFQTFVRDSGLGHIEPTLCEITYINHIDEPDPGRVLSVLAGPSLSSFLPAPEQSRYAAVHKMASPAGEYAGRLDIAADPGVRRLDGARITVLNLTARGKPQTKDAGGVMSFLDLAHEWVVRGFDAVTTSQMHERWGRQDAG